MRAQPNHDVVRRGVTGFRAGDAIQTLSGQPLLSMADVQWVLHWTPAAGGVVTATVFRAGRPADVTWTLPAGWRRRDDISWRASSWGLRRMATVGMLLEPVPAAERPAGLPPAGMALRVKHVGQYAPHAAAKAAGFRAGDILTAFDGNSDLTRETDVLFHGVTARRPGDQVAVTVRRGGKAVELTLPMQE